MKKRVHYPEEIKWRAIKMKKKGYLNRIIMEVMGVEIFLKLKHR
ncbi:Genomic scaffold, NODE_822_0003 [Bacillus mycoides]|nr:Genomic scaffold, NODE_822_0003 [Bacillus mycoides]